MRKFFYTWLPDGGLIMDFGRDRPLVVVSKDAVPRDWSEFFHRPEGTWNEPQWFTCSVHRFTTRKGREAIKIVPGDTHRWRFATGGGSRTWDGWRRRHLVGEGVILSAAVANSNGGGCWAEIEVIEADAQPMTAEQARLMEEVIE